MLPEISGANGEPMIITMGIEIILCVAIVFYFKYWPELREGLFNARP
jgi:hypothetical protein